MLTGDDFDEIRRSVPDVGSMITTMFVSQGNSLCKLFLVMPRVPSRQSLVTASRRERDRERLTSRLVSREDAPSKECSGRIDHFAHFDRIRSRTHRVHVHLVNLGNPRQERCETGPIQE